MQIKMLSKTLTYLFCLLFLFTTSKLKAQEDISSRKTLTSRGPEIDGMEAGIIGFDDSNYFMLRRYKGQLYLDRLSKILDIEQTELIQTKRRIEGIILEYHSCRLLDGRLYMFFTGHDSKHCTISNFVYEIDKKTLKSIGELRKLNTLFFKGRRSMNRALMKRKVTTAIVSQNESKILLINQVEIEGNTNNLNLVVDMFDNRLNKLLNKTIVIPRSPELFFIENTRVENDGSIIIRGIQYQEKRKSSTSRYSGKPNFNYYIYYINATTNATQEFKVTLNGEFITDVTASTAVNGDIVLTGLYSSNGTFSIKGAFYQRLNSTSMNVVASGKTEFDDAFVLKYATPKTIFTDGLEGRMEATGNPPEFYEYNLKHVLLKNDGGATLVAEQFYVGIEAIPTYIGNTRSTIYIYNFYHNNILIINFDSDGTFLWNAILPKYQHSVNHITFSSFSLMTNESSMFFLYNDNPKNLSTQEIDTPQRILFNGKDTTVLVMAEVDEFGQVSKKALFASPPGYYIPKPRAIKQISANEMLIFYEKANFFYLSKLTIVIP